MIFREIKVIKGIMFRKYFMYFIFVGKYLVFNYFNFFFYFVIRKIFLLVIFYIV